MGTGLAGLAGTKGLINDKRGLASRLVIFFTADNLLNPHPHVKAFRLGEPAAGDE